MKHAYHLHVITDELNLITLGFVAVVVVVVLVALSRLWRKVIEERDSIRHEMPRAIVGELLSTDEFVALHKRVSEVEIKAEYLETRLDDHIEKMRQPESGG